ncbi:MAG TPA: YegS/Rv2252/BmrU family lipid kinase [Bacteriovoracaceae bacterium]|nr:YegS/Rv2252/BmrU family lipid kinase [Bacteriovoracaceae bacterium]
MKSILLLINPKARSGAGSYQEIAEALLSKGLSVIGLSDQEKNADFKQLILTYQEEISYVIVGGGDGTVNRVLSALVETKLPLIVFPLGTANLLARSIQLKANVQDLLELIDTGRTIPVDLGMVNGIYFINVCGLGISTEVNKNISLKLKKLTGPFSFWLTGLKLSPNLSPFKMKLTVDGNTPVVTRTWQITICNGRKYAAWMTIEPDASYSDGTLHCLSTEIKKWWQGFRLLPCYLRGNYRDNLDVTLVAGQEIKIETRHPLQIDVDGDVQTNTPAVFQVKPKVLNLVVPAAALKDSRPFFV